MSHRPFTVDDLLRILQEGAGTAEGIALAGSIVDTDFEELGYESLALLETCGRIEREYGISLDESVLADARTPGQLVDAVNDHLVAA
jgi:minimal PKS acyl carrier protein